MDVGRVVEHLDPRMGMIKLNGHLDLKATIRLNLCIPKETLLVVITDGFGRLKYHLKSNPK